MYIGLFSESENHRSLIYRGLYRPVDFIDYLECGNDELADAILSYFNNSKEGLYTEYSEQSLAQLKILSELLVSEGWRGDLLLFTDNQNTAIPEGFCFLGYDIFALDFYGSPIGEGLMNYDEDYEIFPEWDSNSITTYIRNLNCYGLFDNYSIAQNFSEYFHRINQKYPDCIEASAHWRPYAVYAMSPMSQGTELCRTGEGPMS